LRERDSILEKLKPKTAIKYPTFKPAHCHKPRPIRLYRSRKLTKKGSLSFILKNHLTIVLHFILPKPAEFFYTLPPKRFTDQMISLLNLSRRLMASLSLKNHELTIKINFVVPTSKKGCPIARGVISNFKATQYYGT